MESVGLPREQAEAYVQIIAEIIEGDLTTKQDLKELEYRLIIRLSAIIVSVVTTATAVVLAFAR